MHIGMWYYHPGKFREVLINGVREKVPIPGVDIPEEQIPMVLQSALTDAGATVSVEQIRDAFARIESELRDELRRL